MDSVHEENGVCHPCFLMKKQAVHKDSFSSLILWSIVVLRLHMCCITALLSRTALRMLETLCGFQMVGARFLLFFCLFFKFFLFFRQELCLQQVLFPPQEVLHPSHSQEQHLGWWVSLATLLSFPPPDPCWLGVGLQPPAGAGVPMMPQQPVMYGQPMMRPPFGAATGPGVQVSLAATWMFYCSPRL